MSDKKTLQCTHNRFVQCRIRKHLLRRLLQRGSGLWIGSQHIGFEKKLTNILSLSLKLEYQENDGEDLSLLEQRRS